LDEADSFTGRRGDRRYSTEGNASVRGRELHPGKEILSERMLVASI